MSLEKKTVIGLTLAWLVLYMFGNNMLVITDPVESNYAETAREMLLSGDYFSPRIYDKYWYDKPIMFYVELIVAFKMFGLTEFAARFFPAIMSWACIMLTYWFGRRIYDQRTGMFAGILAMLSLEFWYLGHAVITDTTLLLTESLTLIGFYLGYTEHKPRWYYAAFAAAGVAVLTKGPVGLCLPGLIIMLFLIWQRDFKALFNRHIAGGFVLFFGVISLWYLPMYLMHGSDFIKLFFGVHNVLRATVSEHPRDNVWFYYILIFLAGFFPWSFVFVPAKLRSWWRKRPSLPKMPRERFLLLWAVTVYVVFQSFATKYVSYTFPYMIPVTLFMVAWFKQHEKLFFRMAAVMGVGYVVLMFLVAAPIMREHSARDVAQIVKPCLTEDTQLYLLDSEPASLAFYTGKLPMRLASQALIDKRTAGKGWTAKHVMPLLHYDNLPQDKPVVLVTGQDKRATVESTFPGEWQFVGASGEFEVYTRQAIK